MNLHGYDFGEIFHTALRKNCYSKFSSVLWELINRLEKKDSWPSFCEHGQKVAESYNNVGFSSQFSQFRTLLLGWVKEDVTHSMDRFWLTNALLSLPEEDWKSIYFAFSYLDENG